MAYYRNHRPIETEANVSILRHTITALVIAQARFSNSTELAAAVMEADRFLGSPETEADARRAWGSSPRIAGVSIDVYVTVLGLR